jgi:fructose-1-phosphate kinase PfkB-like protein
MSRRVATITLNPAYDLVGFCPEIERGEVTSCVPPACMLRERD